MKITNIVLAVFLAVSITSCFDSEEVDFGKGPVLAQFQNTTDELNIIKDAANTPIDYQIPITFFGGRNVPLDRDMTITIATSAESEATEGVEFELISDTFTIPAGETTVNAEIKILTANLVPFDFKDIVLEIIESSESVSDNNKISLTLKALDANTLAGTYEAVVGEYWNSGTQRSGYEGRTFSIAAISPGLYKHVGIAFWTTGNDFFFTVDDATGLITVLDKDLEGEPTLLNGSPIMTCDNNYAFEMVVCDDTTSVSILQPDGHHIVKLTTGYHRGAGSTREFYEELVRL